MSEDLTIAPIGLYTNPSALGSAPQGACLKAEDVVIRRKGRVEPRPGFPAKETLTFARMVKFIPYSTSYLGVGDAGTGTTRWSGNTRVFIEDGTTDPSWDKWAARGVEARKNLYATTNDVVRKLTSITDTHATRASLPVVTILQDGNGSGNQPLLTDNTVGWRAVLRRTDANNLIVRGAPSGMFVWTSTGATITPRLAFSWSPNAGTVAGDVIELYRTRNTTASIPPDDCFLAFEYTLNGTDILLGTLIVDDTRMDDDLGVALYTNESREGIENSNERMPRVRDLALFRGSLFGCNLTYPYRMVVQFNEGGLLTGVATGIGRRVANGVTCTNGSNVLVLAAVGDNVGLKVGMVVRAANTTDFVTLTTHITAIAGTSVTVSSNWDGTTGAKNLQFLDAIRVVGATTEYFPVRDAATLVAGVAGNATDRATASTQVVARAIGLAAHFSSTAVYHEARIVEFENIVPTGPVFALSATHGSEYTPPLPETTTTGTAATQEAPANGLAWSKFNEPEHWSLLDIEQIGGERDAIMRVVDTKDALWVFKSDGIWRVTGAGRDSGFRIDPYDVTTRLLHPEALTKLDDAIYAWTDRGIVRVSDAGGVERLSEDPIGDQLAIVQQHTGPGSTTDVGMFATSNPKAHEVLFGVPNRTTFDSVSYAPIFVYNAQQQTWARWFPATTTINSAAYLPVTGQLVLGSNASGVVLGERTLNDGHLNADASFAITVSAVAGTAITINGASGWTPAVGDAIDTGAVFIVTAFSDATHFTVDKTGVSAGAGTAYVSYQSCLELIANVAKQPGVYKHWQRGAWTMGALNGVANVQFMMGSSVSTATKTWTRSIKRDSGANDEALRFNVPRGQSRSIALLAQICIQQAASAWTIEGLTLFYELMGTQSASARVGT